MSGKVHESDRENRRQTFTVVAKRLGKRYYSYIRDARPVDGDEKRGNRRVQ